MIDVQSYVFSQVKAKVLTVSSNATVSSMYVSMPESFPYVSVVEEDNYTSKDSISSKGTENRITLLYEVNVYSNKKGTSQSEARKIINAVSECLYGMNFTRISQAPVPNLMDNTIYRITARYRVETDGTNFYVR